MEESQPALAGESPLLQFVPGALLTRLRAAGDRLPAEVQLPAAVLFADVSRYSTWVELLLQRGSDRLEKMPSALDRTYGTAAARIHDSGGEVVHILGDALIAYWAADDRPLSHAVQAACDCAADLCARHSLRRGWEELEPDVHVGVGFGKLWAAGVGGFANQWNLVVGGTALRSAAAAQSRARRREVEHAPEVAEVLRKPSSSQRFAAVRRPVLDAHYIRQFLPGELQALRTARAEPADGAFPSHEEIAQALDEYSDIRPITAVFALVRDLGEADPGALDSHHGLCRRLQELLAMHDVPAGQLAIDDKGLVFTAVLGAPGRFHHDDPVRAVEVAMAIHRAVTAFGLQSSIGVASGDACFRVIGPGVRRQPIVVGAPMNRAARLSALGQDGVLCDGVTAHACRSTLAFEVREAINVTGLSQPVQTYRPTGKREPSRERLPLLGRAREVGEFKTDLENVLGGQTRLLVIAGEPGIGKTRLVEEFIAIAAARGVWLALARAQRSDQSTAFLPWRRIFLAALELPDETANVAVLGEVRARLAGHAPLLERLPLLTSVFPCEVDETEVTRDLSSASRADATIRYLSELLALLSRGPRLIVFEDSHWVDSASLRLIEWVLGQIPSLLLVLCQRRDEASVEFLQLQTRIDQGRSRTGPAQPQTVERNTRVLSLEELDEKVTGELAALKLGEAPLSDQLVRKIGERSRGNPFFAEEIALALRDERLIAVRGGRWEAVSPDIPLGQFQALERVLTERLDRLGRDDRQVLRAAAVFGRTFPRSFLEYALRDRIAHERLVESMAELERRSLVRHAAAAPEHYEFRHDQIRDVVYASMPVEFRRELHGAVAAWLQKQQGGADAAQLVLHFDASGEFNTAAVYAERAAYESMRGGAFREAEQFLDVCLRHDRSIESKEGGTKAFRLRRLAAEASQGRGDVDGQQRAIEDALSFAGRVQPRTGSQAGWRMLIGVARCLTQLLVPVRANIDAQRREDELEFARCYMQAAGVHYYWHRSAHCAWATVAALNHALRAGPSAELAMALAQAGGALGLMGLTSLADRFIARARRITSEVEDRTAHAWVRMIQGLYRIGFGDWSLVREAVDESQELSERAGDALNWCNAQAVRFWMHHYLGDRAQAEQAAEVLLARAQNSGNVQQELWALRCKAVCALAGDRPKQARDYLQLSLSALAESADLAERVASRGCMALAHTRLGAHGEAIAVVRETISLYDKIPRPTVHSTLDSTAAVAEVLLRGREEGLHRAFPHWRDWENTALRQLDRHRRVFPVATARYGLWSGVRDWLDGRRRRAAVTWERALIDARRLRLKGDEACIVAEVRRLADLA